VNKRAIAYGRHDGEGKIVLCAPPALLCLTILTAYCLYCLHYVT